MKSLPFNEEILILERELVDSKDNYDELIKEKVKYKTEEINNKDREISSLPLQINSLSRDTYLQLISELGVTRSQHADKIQALQSTKNIDISDHALHSILADKDGVIHYLSPIKEV